MSVLGIPFSIAQAFFRLFFQTIPLALGQIWANKMRAVLTALGIIIGTCAVIAVVGGLTGMKNFVLGEFATFGTRNIWLWGDVPDSQRATMSWTDVKVTTYEANLILDQSPSIGTLTMQTRMSETVSFGKKTKQGVRVMGMWPEWHTIENRDVIYGRRLSNIDVQEKRQVCLVNEAAVEELNLDKDPTGDFLLVGNRRFLIIGVLETKDVSVMFGGGESQTELFIPFETAKAINPYTWSWFMMQIREPGEDETLKQIAADATAELRFILRSNRDLHGDDEDTFESQVMQSNIEQFSGVAGIIGIVATGVVSVSLLVGGVGIMNIMLVSVSERTREIGLRKAMGARPLVVLIQFLVEAVMLCLVGGFIGLGLGYAILSIPRFLPDITLEPEVPAWAVTLAIGFSAAVGVVFGMFPAIKAALLNPIDALRHE